MARDSYILEARAVGCRAEVFVNAFPAAYLTLRAGTIARPVNELLVDGQNTLDVVVEPGPHPSVSLTGDRREREVAGMSVEARISLYRAGSFPGDGSGTQLLEVRWRGDEKQKLVCPHVVRGTHALRSPFGAWLWQKAPAVTLGKKEPDEIAEVIAGAHRAFQLGDPKPVAELTRVQSAELARAYDDPGADDPNELAAMVAELTSKPGWAMEPLDRDQFDLRVVGPGGRLVECVAKDWEPIVRSRLDTDGEQFLFPMLLARLDGRWVVAR